MKGVFPKSYAGRVMQDERECGMHHTDSSR
jgi:hypothetical protein